MSEENRALLAAQNSWARVQAKDKQGWLDLMADDVCIEDPIGKAPTNPSGRGLCGKAEVAEFYDKNIAPTTIRIEAHESFATGNESAHVLSLTTTFPNGVVARVRSIFTYRINDDGLLISLRGYWHMGMMEFEQPAKS